ncbi:hypothetical protein N0V93_001396 [Gnomoniopsis smithogilvyi]|uniref:Phenazine biosynthesis protein n=1 Tax=Gnomoniopsis smithogilvyi TaxID=1191159 RepID=A0A9W9D159_9PEZI|nr:hypothetical protein N0V93_001396 [Gnomoniopsis smithogilvyi]
MHFVTLDVFTDTPFLGNPLAIVVVEDKERSALDKDDNFDIKQLIAKEFNLSETVFLYLRPNETLSSPDRSSSEREMRIYTIESELPFAGHPTIGVAYLLRRHLGWDFVNTITPRAGPIHLTSTDNGSVTARIPHDVHLHSRTLRTLYDLGDKDITSQIHPALHDDQEIRDAELDAPMFSIVKGMTFLLVELPSIEHLGKVNLGKRLDLGNYVSLLDAGSWGHGFTARYYYVRQAVAAAEDGTRTETIRTRMVELGFEDPATGSAASALSCHLSLNGDVEEVRYRITQGVEIGRKSDIEVNVVSGVGEDGVRAIKEVRLGGSARVVMSGSIDV